MDNVKNNNYYLEKLLVDLRFIIKHTKNIKQEDLLKEEVLLDSIMFRFIQISEHVKKLTAEFKEVNSHVPWRNIIGLRNRIVHEYGNIDLDIVYSAINKDIYDIVSWLESI